jgi:hypothetical protein
MGKNSSTVDFFTTWQKTSVKCSRLQTVPSDFKLATWTMSDRDNPVASSHSINSKEKVCGVFAG